MNTKLNADSKSHLNELHRSEEMNYQTYFDSIHSYTHVALYFGSELVKKTKDFQIFTHLENNLKESKKIDLKFKNKKQAAIEEFRNIIWSIFSSGYHSEKGPKYFELVERLRDSVQVIQQSESETLECLLNEWDESRQLTQNYLLLFKEALVALNSEEDFRVSRGKRDIEFFLNCGQEHLNFGNFEFSEHFLCLALSYENESNCDLWRELAKVYCKQGKFDLASQCFRRCLDIDKLDEEFLLCFAICLNQNGNLEASLDAFRKCDAIYPATPLTQVLTLAAELNGECSANRILRRVKQVKNSCRSYESQSDFEISEDLVLTFMEAIRFCMDLNAPEFASKLCELFEKDFIQNNEDEPVPKLDRDSLIIEFRLLLACDSHRLTVGEGNRQVELKELLEKLNLRIRKMPESSLHHQYKAQVALQLGDSDLAIRHFKRSMDLFGSQCSPSNPIQVLISLAELYFAKNQFLESKEIFEISSRYCRSELGLKGLGKCLFHLKDYKVAEIKLMEANCINNKDSEIWLYLCALCRLRREEEKANACLAKVIDLRPNKSKFDIKKELDLIIDS
ncbi:MAG: Cilia- and flagella-associated protein 70, variant 2 [Marteilia pararefringens]